MRQIRRIKAKHVLADVGVVNSDPTAFTGINLRVKVVRVGKSIRDCIK